MDNIKFYNNIIFIADFMNDTNNSDGVFDLESK